MKQVILLLLFIIGISLYPPKQSQALTSSKIEQDSAKKRTHRIKRMKHFADSQQVSNTNKRHRLDRNTRFLDSLNKIKP